MCFVTLKQYKKSCYNDEIDLLSLYNFLCYNMVNNTLELGGIKMPQIKTLILLSMIFEQHIMTPKLWLNLNINRKVLYRNINELML